MREETGELAVLFEQSIFSERLIRLNLYQELLAR